MVHSKKEIADIDNKYRMKPCQNLAWANAPRG